MTSSFFTFDVRYDINIQPIQSLGTGKGPCPNARSLLWRKHNLYVVFNEIGLIVGISNKRHPILQVKSAQNTCHLIFFSDLNSKWKECYRVIEPILVNIGASWL